MAMTSVLNFCHRLIVITGVNGTGITFPVVLLRRR